MLKHSIITKNQVVLFLSKGFYSSKTISKAMLDFTLANEDIKLNVEVKEVNNFHVVIFESKYLNDKDKELLRNEFFNYAFELENFLKKKQKGYNELQ